MRTNFFSSSQPSSPLHSNASSPSRVAYPSTPTRQSFSASMMEENVEIAAAIVNKWDVDAPTFSKFVPLFSEDRREAKEFLSKVKDLQIAMRFFVSENCSQDMLVRAQKLMQTAMKRLQKEFHQILSANRESSDPESVSGRSSLVSARSSTSDFEDDSSEEEIQAAANSTSDTATSDLKAIADCMISTGYSKECVNIYKLIRKSIIDETLYHLGVEILSASQIHKMDWEVLEVKIKTWSNAVKIAVKTLFLGERILCDSVFAISERISDSCFAEISKDGAKRLFVFPELVAREKKSSEKMFRILDLYEAIADLWPEIESIFSSELVSDVKTQAVTSLVKLGEAARTMLSDFETAIQKDSSKLSVPGGGVHPLTRYVMNYLVFLTDYSGVLSDIVADFQLTARSPLPETYFTSPTPDDSPSTAIAVRLAWMILVLLCKLDGKAELYKDVSLSYLFLANNLNYIVNKVGSSNLRLLLGEAWLYNHEKKVKQYAANYVRMGWSKVTAALPENPTANTSSESAEESFKRFNSAFEEAYRKQASWIVTDNKLRDEIKISLAKKIVQEYRGFYDGFGFPVSRRVGAESIVRYAPDDLENYLSDLFHGMSVSGGASSSSSTPSSTPSRWRERRQH